MSWVSDVIWRFQNKTFLQLLSQKIKANVISHVIVTLFNIFPDIFILQRDWHHPSLVQQYRTLEGWTLPGSTRSAARHSDGGSPGSRLCSFLSPRALEHTITAPYLLKVALFIRTETRVFELFVCWMNKQCHFSFVHHCVHTCKIS